MKRRIAVIVLISFFATFVAGPAWASRLNNDVLLPGTYRFETVQENKSKSDGMWPIVTVVVTLATLGVVWLLWPKQPSQPQYQPQSYRYQPQPQSYTGAGYLGDQPVSQGTHYNVTGF